MEAAGPLLGKGRASPYGGEDWLGRAHTRVAAVSATLRHFSPKPRATFRLYHLFATWNVPANGRSTPKGDCLAIAHAGTLFPQRPDAVLQADRITHSASWLATSEALKQPSSTRRCTCRVVSLQNPQFLSQYSQLRFVPLNRGSEGCRRITNASLLLLFRLTSRRRSNFAD
jgi:hypothetical protein